MDEELNKLLKQAYDQYKDVKNPPVPIEEIKEYLELEGIEIEK
jgi:hypothetical protein